MPAAGCDAPASLTLRYRCRISRLRENENLEDAPSAVSKCLGELKRPYLTAVEEKLLSFIELEYGVDSVLQ